MVSIAIHELNHKDQECLDEWASIIFRGGWGQGKKGYSWFDLHDEISYIKELYFYSQHSQSALMTITGRLQMKFKDDG